MQSFQTTTDTAFNRQSASPGEGGAAYSSTQLLRVFWPFFRPYRWRIAGAALALLMVAGALLTMGRGLAYLVDQGLGKQDPELLDRAVLGTAVIALLLAGLHAASR